MRLTPGGKGFGPLTGQEVFTIVASDHKCSKCGLTFRSTRGLNKHFKDEHSGKLPSLPDEKVKARQAKSYAKSLQMDASEVPPREFFDRYVSRSLVGGLMDIDVFERCYHMQRWTIVYGPTGNGKTFVGMALAAKIQVPYCSINFHGAVNPDLLIGRWIPKAPDMPTIEELRTMYKDEDGNVDSGLIQAYVARNRSNYEWVDGRITKYFREGGILDLAEVNMAPPSVCAFLFQMLDERRQIVLDDKDGEVVHCHPQFWCMANYNVGYIGTEPMNEALSSRFPVKFEWKYDLGVERVLIKNPMVRSVGIKLRNSGELRTDVGTRDLIFFEENIELFGQAMACEMFAAGFQERERPAVREALKLEFSRSIEQVEAELAEGTDKAVEEEEVAAKDPY